MVGMLNGKASLSFLIQLAWLILVYPSYIQVPRDELDYQSADNHLDLDGGANGAETDVGPDDLAAHC